MSNLVDRALLIDDSEIDLFIQRRFLEVFNFSRQLQTFASAKEALAWLRQQEPQSLPQLIFLDLNMPDVDGFGFLLNFAELPESVRNTIRVVILTSSNSTIDLDRALAFKNVVHFITKPLKQSDIETLRLKLAS
jgi:two-component system, NarL family, nitrate/nitrite response regulator NarL